MLEDLVNAILYIVNILFICSLRYIPNMSNFCITETEPYGHNLLGIFKTLPVLIAAMSDNGHGIILIKGKDGLGHHHWRLDSEVAHREKLRLEQKLANRRVSVITEAVLDNVAWKDIFPMQLQAVRASEIEWMKHCRLHHR